MTTIRETINRDRVGTTEWRARAQLRIPLDDPEAYGNGGLQGFDEDGVSESFGTKARAERWLRQQITKQPQMISGTVTRYEWEADDFDWQGERILDAFERPIHSWSYWVNDGALEPDGDWEE